MKTNVRLWKYPAQFFVQWEMFQTEVADKIKTRILYSITFLLIVPFWDEVEKYGTARHATDGNIIWHMRFVCQARHTQNM